MKKKSTTRSAFINSRVIVGFVFCAIGALLALVAFGLYPAGSALAQGQQQNQAGKVTPADAFKTLQDIKPMVNRSSEGLVQVQRADGSVSMNLQGRFQNVMIARKEANGTVSQSCVDNPESAAAFLGIDPHTAGAKPADPKAKNQTTAGPSTDR